MPDRMAESFVLFVRQNNGTLAKRRRDAEFAALSNEEVTHLETIVRDAFAGFDEPGKGPHAIAHADVD